MLYDAIQYVSQVDEIAKEHRKSKKMPETKAEYLSGFCKGDKILPIITLTLYFGADEWDAPRDLHSMLSVDEDILRFIDNYHLHLIAPAEIRDEDFAKFHTELSLALKYVKYQSSNSNTTKGLDQTHYSYNWAGYVAKGNFVMAQGDFTQPTINSSNPSYTRESTSIGFGGFNSAKLVMAGTAIDTYGGTNHYYAFYEYLSASSPNPEVQLNSITINPGDNIHIYISFQQANNLFNVYIANNTNGTSQSILVNISASEYFDGSTANYIVSLPNISGTSNGLTNFGMTNWWNCQAYTMNNVWQSLGSTTYDKIIMLNPSNNSIRALPSAVNGQSFSVTWYNY